MHFYLWSLFIAILLPYVWVGIAKFSQTGYNNRKPRIFIEGLSGARQRAHWAHLNAFEALPIFLAAVFVAHTRGVDPTTINQLALVWVIARVMHGVFYISDLHWFRSSAWGIAMLCNIVLFWQAAQTKSTDRLFNMFS